MSMDKKILRLLELIKAYNGGEVYPLLEEEFKAFADKSNFNIEDIDDLIEAMETEMSYWEY